MPNRDKGIFPFDQELLDDLKKFGKTRANRKVVLKSRQLIIVGKNGKRSTTCVLPKEIYDKLKDYKVAPRTKLYWAMRKELEDQNANKL